MIRIRIKYAKTEDLRYIGTLDLHKVWERFLRRAQLPVAYSQGFHPQPKIQQACPLPLGFLSATEFIDIWLDQDEFHPLQIRSALEQAKQPGISLFEIEEIPIYAATLQTRVMTATYQVEFLSEVDIKILKSKIHRLMEQAEVHRERRGKTYDLRRLILKLELQDPTPDGHFSLIMELLTKEGATGRPEEVISELGYDPYSVRYSRLSLTISPELKTTQ